jgi:predicted GH43/DUF377 family glycosyl hydrolase
MSSVSVTRTAHRLLPDPRRVLAKPYLPGEEISLESDSRTGLLMERVLAIPEDRIHALLSELLVDFAHRHEGFEAILAHHFDLVAHHIRRNAELSRERRLLIGAYFTHEYSIESAALFNPSIVVGPNQDGLRPGERRFVMSLRAVGEGHISSIEFREGIIDAAGELSFAPVGPLLVGGKRTSPSFDKWHFRTKLAELGGLNEIASTILDRLPEQFTIAELEQSLGEADGLHDAIRYETTKIIHALATSNYETTFPPTSALSERVIFPAGPHETRGMEDARFVRFVGEDGAAKYYATYTAFDGFKILPQLIETEDFLSFKISTLNGAAAQNKGMALFPRQIGGVYAMLSRRDRENLHLATSRNLQYWNDVTEILRPTHPWELLHIGNCGSPLETEAGWLVLTHGVGPMRRYALGALLLDLEDPARVVGHLREPLLFPIEAEREGYVPNVLYTCGGLINGAQLVLPYGFSDHGIGIARVSLPELLEELTRSGPAR